jgi:hypothetical protein
MQASHKLLIICLQETPAFAGVKIIDLALPYFAEFYTLTDYFSFTVSSRGMPSRLYLSSRTF